MEDAVLLDNLEPFGEDIRILTEFFSDAGSIFSDEQPSSRLLLNRKGSILHDLDFDILVGAHDNERELVKYLSDLFTSYECSSLFLVVSNKDSKPPYQSASFIAFSLGHVVKFEIYEDGDDWFISEPIALEDFSLIDLA